MSDIVLQHMTNGQNISAANSNFDVIQDKVNNDLLQNKGGDNVMYQDLDMNSHNLLNTSTLSVQGLFIQGVPVVPSSLSSLDRSTFNLYMASPPPIGGTLPSSATFTTLTSTGATSLGPLSASSINGTPIGTITKSSAIFTLCNTDGGNLNGTIGQSQPFPGWFTNLSVSGSITGIPGRLLNVRSFTSSGTYTPTAGTASIIVEVQAPGGGGGGSAATGASQSSMGGGGGAGSYAMARITQGFSGVTMTIPAGGAGGAIGTAGTAGATASFGTFVSCPGGTAGAAGTASSTALNVGISLASAVPTVTGTGVTSISTAAGGSSIIAYIISPTVAGASGTGASCIYGTGGTGRGNGAGFAANGYGAGGGGGATLSASSAGQVGGNGSPGLIVVYEYC